MFFIVKLNTQHYYQLTTHLVTVMLFAAIGRTMPQQVNDKGFINL